MPRTIPELIDGLGGIVAVAKHLDVPVSTVGSWKARERIAEEYRPKLIELARQMGVRGVNYESLTMMHVGNGRSARAAS